MKRSLCLLLIVSLLFLPACGESERPDDRPTEGVGVVTLSAVGDIFPTDDMLADARRADGSYDFTAQLSEVFAALSASDLTIGNFEGTFSGAPYGAASGSYPDEFAAALKTAGFDLLQTANSFSIYNGLTGLRRTRSVILENAMTPVGTYDSAAEQRENPVVLREVNGVRVAFLALTKGMGGMSLPEDAEGCVDLLYEDYTTDYSEPDALGLLDRINAAKELDADFIVAALHWGSEGIQEPSEKQEQLADFLFRNGVDVILGSHSHLPGRVERRTVRLDEEREKDVVLAYSLGDFCAAEEGGCDASLILTLELTRNHETGETAIGEVRCTPIAAIDRGAENTDRYAVLDVDNTIALYENNYYRRVSRELYEQLVQKRKDLFFDIEAQ